MKAEIFAFLLLLVSLLTGLVTEAIKKIAAECGVRTKPNTTAGIIALAVSVVVGVGWVLYTGAVWTAQVVIAIVALVFLGWLCAMVGYDKVIQTLAQLRVQR